MVLGCKEHDRSPCGTTKAESRNRPQEENSAEWLIILRCVSESEYGAREWTGEIEIDAMQPVAAGCKVDLVEWQCKANQVVKLTGLILLSLSLHATMNVTKASLVLSLLEELHERRLHTIKTPSWRWFIAGSPVSPLIHARGRCSFKKQTQIRVANLSTNRLKVSWTRKASHVTTSCNT